MTSADTKALIEEARRWAALFSPPYGSECMTRLADALESSEAARRDLTDKIAHSLTTKFYGYDTREMGRAYDADSVDELLDELRGLVSGDKKEQQ